MIISKEKRKRIFKETVFKGELVAKSYVSLDFRKNITEHAVYYLNVSYKIIDR